MSKLEQVRFSLINNRNVRIVHINEIKHLEADSYFAHVVDFQVVPVENISISSGIEYNMQLLIEKLASSINVTPDIVESSGIENNLLNLGRICFDEIIARKSVRSEEIIINPDLCELSFFGSDFSNSCSENVKDYRRRIYISPFPNEEIADRYKFTNYIGCVDLKQFR